MRDSGDPVSPGQALAAARREAGLSVAEVSQKTRIREAIIRGIEQDDYSVCGGDFYARGHIRAMARAAGANPDPLIQEYDAAHRGPVRDAPDSTDQFPAIRGPFEPPIVAPAKPTASHGGLGNFQLVDQGSYGADTDYPAGPPEGDTGYAEPGSHQAASDYGSSEDYGTAGSYAASGSYEISDPYGALDTYEEPENYEELNEPTTAYGGAGSSDGYRRVDELARDWDAPYKPGAHSGTGEPHRPPGAPFGTGEPHRPPGAPFGTGEPHRPPGEPVSIGGDRNWFLGLTEPPDTSRPARPSGPARPSRPARRPTEPRRPGRWAAVTLVLLAALGLVSYLMLSSSGASPSANSGSPSGKATTGHPASHPASRGHTTSPPSSPPHSAPPPPQVLQPASIVAFGPSGPGQGDDPQDARLAIDHARGTFWQTDWYATAFFGNLQSGTGLLLDMGHPVTITGAQVTLGPERGARLQLRAGSTPALNSLRKVASAFYAGGLVQLHAATPVTARYVLIWFTKLPPNANGNFQARVYDIKVQ